MKKYSFIGLVLTLLILTPVSSGAEIFRYQFSDGDSYRINSKVQEQVFSNRRLSHEAEITNRITVTVSDVKAATATEPGSARHDCTFMTSERNSNRAFAWGREYLSVFRRDDRGVYDIADIYFMPVVRNVPTFPDRDVKPGESWTGEGEEAHDFRDTFGIQKPFRVPFTVTYTYIGLVERGGKKLHQIQAEYLLIFDSPETAKTASADDYPVTTMGNSRQRIFWDNELGIISEYDETFRIQLQLASGTVLEFRGTASATVTETKLMDRNQIVQDMNKELSRMGITDANATSTAEGITISLENIQFEADSANLLPSEKEKITEIAALLERYPDKELLISGHTALAGTAASRQKLSEERAEAVARFLVAMGVRSDYNVYSRGFGAEKPIAPNDTEANRSRNRRVEITILEK